MELLNSEAVQRLEAWMTENGAEYSLAIASCGTSGGRALCVTRDVACGDVFLRIPRKLMLSAAVAQAAQNELGQMLRTIPPEVFQETSDSIKNLYMVLFLMHERACGESSFWYPHLALQPSSFSSPLFYDDDEMEWLLGTPLHPLVLAIKQELAEIFDKVRAYAAEHHPTLLEWMNLDNFLWAVSVVDSRAFRLTIGDEDITIIMPLVDMANHQPEGVHFDRVYDAETEMLNITYKGQQRVVKGSELQFQYSPLTNWQALQYYGFAMDPNPHDSIEISFPPIQDADLEVDMKKQIFLSMFEDDFTLDHSIAWKRQESSSNLTVHLTDELLPSLRLMLMNKEELEGVIVQNVVEVCSKMVSVRNETCVLEQTLNLLEAMLYSYPTSLEIDDELLDQHHKTSSLTEKKLFALIYRRGQKQLIKAAFDDVQSRLDALESA
ncbi:Histone-lysine N-methyltransferase setd3 [Porphyridium purpureum]|uniref:Histone-lysine N-methyltransferase setd3 n=1 Tax=Porphyridium purpureum TaxID=35688 RepID=A0A5J4YNX4_PORPP|nr:Histone-lysine N-methyltransferase setd3 [Porphyridium purpureum]|eukprot:POR0785..scf222_8